MFGSGVLEVAIGIVFIYLVLSMVCTMINEAIATVINKRGTNLFEGIKNLLNDPNFTGLAQQVYSHGLVDGISKNAVVPDKDNRCPSYMSSKTFSLALLDILGTHGVVAAAYGELLSKAEEADDEYQEASQKEPKDQQVIKEKEGAAIQARTDLVDARDKAKAAYDQAVAAGQDSNEAKNALDAATAAVKMLDVRRAAIESARDKKNRDHMKEASDALEAALFAGRTLAAEVPNQLANLQTAVRRLPAGHTKETLFVLLDKAKREATTGEAQLVKFREEVEHWFNDAMDRVGGWYKRWTQWVLLGISAVLVISLNADTVMLAKSLSIEKDLRATIVDKIQRQNENFKDIQANLGIATLPIGWSQNPNDPRRWPLIVPTKACEENSAQKANPANKSTPTPKCLDWGQVDWGQALWLTATKLFGLLLTVAALSLGAPFWFDSLSKFINLRGAGTPPGEKKKSAPQTASAS